MEYLPVLRKRMMNMKHAALLLPLFLSLAGQAQELTTPPTPGSLAEAEAQRERATAMRQEADRRYEAEANACYGKILINQCLSEAQQRRQQRIIESRNLDLPAREFQREVKRNDFAAKEAQRKADAPERAARQQAQADNFRSEEARRAANREQKLAEKAEKAVKNQQKAATENARRQEKASKRAEKEAKRAKEKAARDARAESRSPG